MRMTKKKIALEDGRYLIYFSFGGRNPARAEGAKRPGIRRSGVRRGRD